MWVFILVVVSSVSFGLLFVYVDWVFDNKKINKMEKIRRNRENVIRKEVTYATVTYADQSVKTFTREKWEVHKKAIIAMRNVVVEYNHTKSK